MGWFSSDPPVDTSSLRYKICLHEGAHAVIAEALGWRVTKISISHDEGGIWANYPGRDTVEHRLQYATWLLAGPDASLRIAWFMPGGCDWDIAQARKSLRKVRGADGAHYGQIKARAHALVGRRWGRIRAEARTLYLTGGR